MIPILIGILGSVLMYIGDMVLYFSRDGYDPFHPSESLITTMSRVKHSRLYIGGLLGPVAGFLCAIGYIHAFTMSTNDHFFLMYFVMLINALGAVLGGAYHLQCAHLGITRRLDDQKAYQETLTFLKIQKIGLAIIMGFGGLVLAVYIAFGMTAAPRWLALVTPAVLTLLLPLLRKLPGTFGVLIAGGWLNLACIIYYIVLTYSLLR